MRVYEFSKESGISSKDLLARLRKAGFTVKSHMSLLPDDALKFLRKEFAKKMSTKEQIKQKQPVVPVQQVAKKIKKEPVVQADSSRPNLSLVEQEQQDLGVIKEITLEPMLVADLAQKVGVPVNDLILTLLKSGVIAPKNKVLSEEVVETVARHYNTQAVRQVHKKSAHKEVILDGKNLEARPPIVVVMGHVDHGKTTLLDFIRNTRVASREKGGITQHLGAYHVSTDHGGVIFLDTPGHAAFTKMRARGVNVADIVVLVIAADDGIMPQTVESIKTAKEMQVPIIVAINKIDKADSQRLEVVRRQLSQHDLLPEDWGGDTVVVPVSAKEGTGIDHLIELLVLQSEMMDLKADANAQATGYILESKVQKGLGAVGTLLCRQGTVRTGDFFVCGNTVGKVSALIDSDGTSTKEAGPSVPVQVAGFQDLPSAGDIFRVVSQQEYKKARAHDRPKDIFRPQSMYSKNKSINLFIKADTHSSQEALIDAIYKLNKKSEVEFSIVSSSVGNVSENDIDLAAATNAIIVGLHVKTDAKATSMAQRLKVVIEHYDIIYKLLESLEERAYKAREVKKVATKIGTALVRKVFDIKSIGIIAGCYVQDGKFSQEGSVEVWRGKNKIGEGKIKSLQRENKTVKEVHAGYECAFSVENLTDFKVDDRIDCFVLVPEAKKK